MNPLKALLAGAALILCAVAWVAAADARKPNRPPIVFLLLDELPSDTLLDRPGHIDGIRYPSFAALARDSTWFPNTQAVADMTSRAVPAILDGRRPRRGLGHDYRTHPNSLFTLAKAHGYRLRVREVLTRVCSWRLCGRGDRTEWQRNRDKRFAKFLRSLHDRGAKLWFEHTILPHSPWAYLPSGNHYPRGSLWLDGPKGFHDEFLTRQYQQRYTLQLGFVDRLLGRMLARLRRTGLYDKALIVVTADHGVASDLGVADRRKTTGRTIDELAPVPLFIKAPHQRRPQVIRALARGTDLLPTIAGMLRWRVRWRVDGRSVFSPALRRRRIVSMPARNLQDEIRVPLNTFKRRRARNVRRRVQLLGSGHDSLFRIGPHTGLMGRAVGTIPVDGYGNVDVRIRQDGVDRVDLASPIRPVEVVATVLGGTATSSRDVALAVNGVVVGTGRSFHLRGDPAEYISVMMPEASLHAGANRVELFEITPEEHLLRLRSG